MADYVFRYKLDGGTEPVFSDPVLEMLRVQLQSVLDVVIPVEGEREVRIDGFKLLRDRSTIHRIFPPAQQSSERFE